MGHHLGSRSMDKPAMTAWIDYRGNSLSRDAEHLGFATCGILLRNKAKPRGHVAGLFELLTVASSCEHPGCEVDRNQG